MKEKQSEWPAGIKKTRQRECVFDILSQAEAPLSAQEIYNRARSADAQVWLSTVYRVLDCFVSEGIAVKTAVMDGGMALYERSCSHHRHYAVCVNCHRVIELINCPMENFEPKIAESDFRVMGHRIEMYGYCKDCDEKMSGIH